MNIAGLSVGDSSHSALNPLGSSGELDRDAFMQLLVTQLKNQDPMKPTNNEEFVAQLANFSSLEQLEQLNGNVLAMIGLNQGNALLSQLTQGSSLIGKNVSWTDPSSGVSSSGTVEAVKITNGLATLQVNGIDIPLGSVSEILADSADGGDGSGDGSGGGDNEGNE